MQRRCGRCTDEGEGRNGHKLQEYADNDAQGHSQRDRELEVAAGTCAVANGEGA